MGAVSNLVSYRLQKMLCGQLCPSVPSISGFSFHAEGLMDSKSTKATALALQEDCCLSALASKISRAHIQAAMICSHPR